jgi:hypothetical protein
MNAKSVIGTLAVAAVSALAAPAISSPARVTGVAGSPTSGQLMQPGSQISGDNVPAGTQLHARLVSSISTKNTKAGSEYFATVRTPVFNSRGQAIIPAGSQIVGHVLNARRSPMYRGRANIALSVDGANIYGTFVPLNARVSSYSSLVSRRSGIFLRQNAELPAGTELGIELQGPVSVAQLERAANVSPPRVVTFIQLPSRAVGGGPSSVHHHRARRSGASAASCPAGCTASQVSCPAGCARAQ